MSALCLLMSGSPTWWEEPGHRFQETQADIPALPLPRGSPRKCLSSPRCYFLTHENGVKSTHLQPELGLVLARGWGVGGRVVSVSWPPASRPEDAQ